MWALALAGVSLWLESPTKRRVTGSITCQGHMPGLQVPSWPQLGHVQGATNQCVSHIDVSLPQPPSSCSLALSKNQRKKHLRVRINNNKKAKGMVVNR